MYVTVSDLAAELGLHPDTTRRIAVETGKALGIEPVRKQLSERTPRRVLCWTRVQADQIMAERKRQGFNVPDMPLARRA